MQRSVRENVALPSVANLRNWGLIDLGREGRTVNGAVTRLQVDARAGAEVRRLSGGNQQKVTIARWVAGGVRTLLCFDPTRGIDIGTKNQIYQLLRDLADAGAAILLYTSELKEVQLVCDRAIIIFGGRVVDEVGAADADEPTLLRAAYHLKADAAMPEEIVAEAVAAGAIDETAPPTAGRRGRGCDRTRPRRGPGRRRVARARGRPVTAATGTADPRHGRRHVRRLVAAQRAGRSGC